jgi:hypothetical protein
MTGFIIGAMLGGCLGLLWGCCCRVGGQGEIRKEDDGDDPDG